MKFSTWGRGILKSMINKYWRIAFQCCAFFAFGVGSVVFICCLFPFVFFNRAKEDKENTLVQHLIHQCFRFFLGCLSFFHGMEKAVFSGEDRLKKARGVLVVANHPTLLDVVALIRCMPQADCVVKSALWRNWLVRPIIMAAGYISNDQGETMVQEGVRRLQAGRSLLLFPEGTRSPSNGLGDFNRGFAQMAIRAGCPLLPVIIRCEPRALMKGQSIFAVPNRPFRLSVSVQDPLQVSDFVDPSDGYPIAARKLTDGLKRYFEEKLFHEETNES